MAARKVAKRGGGKGAKVLSKSSGNKSGGGNGSSAVKLANKQHNRLQTKTSKRKRENKNLKSKLQQVCNSFWPVLLYNKIICLYLYVAEFVLN